MPNFPGWKGFDVRDFFTKKVGLRVVVDNDATAAAIGESWHAVGRALSSLFYIYMGIGVGVIALVRAAKESATNE